MALIALQHPADDVRLLIEHALGRLGHEILAPEADDGADVLVLEPASPEDLAAARRLRARRPELRIVCVSIAPPFAEARALRPDAYLVKPFSVAGLRSTVESVLMSAQPQALRAG
jgi:DNA-binding NarL/FixJ family response regulator